MRAISSDSSQIALNERGEPVNLNVILRGQSNALLFGMADNWAMLGRLEDDVQRLLGFDGVADTVTVHYAYGEASGANTVNSGTAFLSDWIAASGGDWRNGWAVQPLGQGILDYIRNIPAGLRDDPTAVLWYHSEFDSLDAGLAPAEWESGVRFDAGLVRAALGQSAATVPYLFVSAHPYHAPWSGSGPDGGHQAIRQGMENLAADAGFNADIAARILDMNANHPWDGGRYGGEHLSDSDQGILEGRMARALAETWAAHAKPGSPVASAAGRNIDDHGPRATEATVVGANQILVRFSFDAASRLQALDADAARGIGWAVRSGSGEVAATAAALSGTDGLLLTFGSAIPAGGKVFYGHGYGRLAGSDGAGQGNAVYDDQGMPVWVEAAGLAVTGGGAGTVPPPPPPPPPAGNQPASVSVGTGPDALVLAVSQDAFQGDAQYTVRVDGAQVGGTLTASALRSSGQHDTVTVLGDWAAGAHTATVTFLNDAYGGTASTDRNLYVESATYDGAAVPGAARTLLSAGPASFGFTEAGAPVAAPPPPPPPLPPPPPPPPSTGAGSATVGSGPDSLVLRISQDAYQGSAQYTVSVDGVQVGGTFTASALRGSGQADTLTVLGDWAGGRHTAEVRFLNDAYGGTAATDRNLYVEGASYNGAAVDGAARTLLSAGPAGFGFADAGPVAPNPGSSPAGPTVGAGPDALVLRISQDAWQGSAQYTVSVDGVQVGGTFTASALRGSGQADTVTVLGNWSGGNHTATVAFLNDAYGGTASTDRNLYVESAAYNGAAVPGAARTLLSAGPASFGFLDPLV